MLFRSRSPESVHRCWQRPQYRWRLSAARRTGRKTSRSAVSAPRNGGTCPDFPWRFLPWAVFRVYCYAQCYRAESAQQTIPILKKGTARFIIKAKGKPRTRLLLQTAKYPWFTKSIRHLAEWRLLFLRSYTIIVMVCFRYGM